MKKFIPSIGTIFGFVLSCLFLTFFLVVTSTQFALGALIDIGVDISFATRLQTTIHDLQSMSPLVGIIFSLGLLIAFTVGNYISRLVGIVPAVVFALAGFASIAVTTKGLNSVLDITVIVATRQWDGYLAFCLIGALSGYVFQRLSARFSPTA